MPLPVPNLDDRTFQEIVNEARRKIPLYCPEWTDHNLSDPGITLVELFSWMTEMIIYRLNKVPDKNYLKFLDLIGVKLAPAAPASTEVMFRLTAPQLTPMTIPESTEVSTIRTETDEAIIFTTTEGLTVHPASLQHFLVTRDNERFDERLELLRQWESLLDAPGADNRRLALFNDVPEPGNAFYLGFEGDLRRTILSVTLDCAERAAPGIVPSNPPLLWEYWDAEQRAWVAFHRNQEADAWLEADGTRGLNARGELVFHVPRTAGEVSVALREAYWLRCTVLPWSPETGSYEASPMLGFLVVSAVGGTAMALNIAAVQGELLGVSDGKAGQVFRVSEGPMLPLAEGETVQVEREDGSGWEQWTQVEDFARSGPEDKHFVCDPATGEILFGPAVHSASGSVRHYGAIPPPGVNIGLTSYRYGGGPLGNVGPNTLTTLRSSIPYVASVANRRLASGGVDPESVDSARLRGPRTLRTRNRAITEEDFEFLAREASPSVRRARCIQPREVGSEGDPLPGVVRVLLVPTISDSAEKTVRPDDLRLPRELVEQVQSYLDERRLLTTLLVVTEPAYSWVSVEAKVRARQGADPEQVREAVEDRLYRFIHPIHGGVDGEGWPFGRSLYVAELYAQIQPVPGVEFVEELKVYPVDPVSGERQEAAQTLLIPRGGLICSQPHHVACT